MLKEYPRLKKLWNKMVKNASIKESEGVLTFDNRKKETKEFEKEFCKVLSTSLNDSDKKRIAESLKYLFFKTGKFNTKGRKSKNINK